MLVRAVCGCCSSTHYRYRLPFTSKRKCVLSSVPTKRQCSVCCVPCDMYCYVKYVLDLPHMLCVVLCCVCCVRWMRWMWCRCCACYMVCMFACAGYVGHVGFPLRMWCMCRICCINCMMYDFFVPFVWVVCAVRACRVWFWF